MFVDVPMHLLFLGIVRTVTMDIGTWLKSFKQNAPFCLKCNELLEPIRKFNLPWCRILKYSEERFGGWVSENYYALCRISGWLYSSLADIPIGEGTKCEPKHVTKMLYFMHSMIQKCLTVNDDTDIEKIESTIRCFLIYYDSFSTSISGNSVPGWVTSYNFLSLLNLPETLRYYGCMRPLWEGGMDGESYLKIVKREVKQGLRRNWKMWLVENLLKQKTFNQILNENLHSRQQELREYYIYKDKETIKNCLKNNNMLSGFRVVRDNKIEYYISYHAKQDYIMAVKINVKTENNIMTNFVNYYRIFLSKKNIKLIDMPTTKIGYLLLPHLQIKEDNPRRQFDSYNHYCFIHSDWK